MKIWDYKTGSKGFAGTLKPYNNYTSAYTVGKGAVDPGSSWGVGFRAQGLGL